MDAARTTLGHDQWLGFGVIGRLICTMTPQYTVNLDLLVVGGDASMRRRGRGTRDSSITDVGEK